MSAVSPSDLLFAFSPAANAFHRGSSCRRTNFHAITEIERQNRPRITAIHSNFQIATRSGYCHGLSGRHGLIMRRKRAQPLSPFENLKMFSAETRERRARNIRNRIPKLVDVNDLAF